MVTQEDIAAPAVAGVPPLNVGGLSTLEILGVLFFAMLVICIYREGRHPFRKRRAPEALRSYGVNLASFLFNDFTLWMLSVPTIYFIADGYSAWGLLSGLEDGPAKFLLCFVLLDFTMFAWHYACHHSNLLWNVHRLHHSDPDLNVTTGLRYHHGELILEVLVRSAFMVAIGVDLEVLLGCQAIVSLFVLFHHTNTVLPGEHWLAWVFIVPRLHRVHHSVNRSEHDSNYGAVFSFWDRLLGSLKELEPARIGLDSNGNSTAGEWIKDWLNGHPGFAKATGAVAIPVRGSSHYRRHD